MKTNYDITAAIALRVPNNEILDSYGNQQALDFRTSIELAKEQGFLMGFYYPGDCILAAHRQNGKMTREEWYKMNSSLRKYYYEMTKEEEERGSRY